MAKLENQIRGNEEEIVAEMMTGPVGADGDSEAEDK